MRQGVSRREYRPAGATLDLFLTWSTLLAGFLGLIGVLIGWSITASHAATVQYLYDERGRLVQVIDETGASALYRYDAVGNILEIQRLAANQLTLAAVAPAAGPIGSTVTLSGAGFSTTPTNNQVRFNGVTATVTTATTTQLVVSVPNGATSGRVAIQVGANTVTSSTDFSVLPLPQITSFTPKLGVAGTAVTLTGSGFASPSARNQIFFYGAQAAPSSTTATTIDTKVPTNGRSGPITLKTPAGESTSSEDFLVVPSSLNPNDIIATARLTLGGPAQTLRFTSAGKKGLALVLVPPSAITPTVVTLAVNQVTWSGPNQYQLFDSNGKSLASWSMAGVDQWTPALRLAAGAYLFSIEPPSTVSGDITLQANTAADLLITNANVPAKVGPNSNGSFTIPITYTLKNQGASTAKSGFYTQCYLTTDGILSAKSLPGGYAYNSTLAAGASTVVKQDCNFPVTTATGTYKIIVYADKYQSNPLLPYGDFETVPETNEANNQTVINQTVELGGLPDLTVTDLKVDPVVVNTEGSYTIPIHATIKNQGVSAAKADWYDACYLSTDGTLDNTDFVIGYTLRNTDLAPGASYTTDFTCRAYSTTTPGNYTLFVKTDGIPGTGKYDSTYSRLQEADEINNVISQTITLPTRPDLTVTALKVDPVVVNADGHYSIPVHATIKNQGVSAAKADWYDACYLSTDGTLDNTDVVIGSTYHSTDVAAGTSYTADFICQTSSTTASGNYTVFVKTDSIPGTGKYDSTYSRLQEADETNNVVSQTITLPTRPDLIITAIKVDPIVVSADGSYIIPIHATIKNQGASPAKSPWYDACYLSADGTLDASDGYLGAFYHNTDLAAGASTTVDISCRTTTTAVAGTYSLLVKTDGYPSGGTYDPREYLQEADKTNNVISQSITLPTRPDLAITDLKLDPIIVNADGSYTLPIHATVKNQGVSTAKAAWYDVCYLSADGTLDTSDGYLGYLYHSTDLAPGATYTADISCRTPTTAVPGTYSLLVKTDAYPSGPTYNPASYLQEADETNNVATQTVTLPTRPDLIVTDLKLDPIVVNADGSYTIPIHATIKNQGASTAKAAWYDVCYLSADGTLDISDGYLGYLSHTSDLAPGTSYTSDFSCRTTTTAAPGTYSLLLKTDAYPGGPTYDPRDYIKEADETNNVGNQTITLPTRPDLTITDLKVDAITKNADGSYTVPIHATVKNQGASTAKATWYDVCYLSADGTLDTSDSYLGYLSHGADLAPGASYTTNITCRSSTTTSPGAYSLLLKTDGYPAGPTYDPRDYLKEADETNNVAGQSITLP